MTTTVSAFKSIAPNEYIITPFAATSDFSYVHISGSSENSSELDVSYGEKFYSNTELRTENATYELYDSVLQTFYSPLARTSNGITTISYVPQDTVYVVETVQNVFGEKVLPGSFTIALGPSKSYDDGYGNIIVSSSGTGSVIGRIFYDKGIAVLQPAIYTNLNPDPTWEDEEGGVSPDGWQNLIDRKLTSQLTTADGVAHAFPLQETYAAKIATRTSLYISGYSFYNISVTAGEVYRMSGWVYANGTTWRGIQNGRVPGSDYSIGYIAVLDGSGPTQYNDVTTGIGPIGWQYLRKEITIPSGVTALSVGPFIDGPYPAGQGYGDPVCSGVDAEAGCPGYAWFAGLKIEKISTPNYILPSGGMTKDGIRILSASSVTVSFSSSITLYENYIKASIAPGEFNISPYNNSVSQSFYTGSSITPLQSMQSRSMNPSSTASLAPYITEIGLYTDQNELVAVAKLSSPIQRTFDSTQTFIIKFDT